MLNLGHKSISSSDSQIADYGNESGVETKLTQNIVTEYLNCKFSLVQPIWVETWLNLYVTSRICIDY